MSSQKFSFINENPKRISHNLDPMMTILVIQNDEEEYDVLPDCYEQFEFLGNKFVIKWDIDPKELDDMEDEVNYEHVRSILRRAWHYYKSHVRIEKRISPPGPDETDKYIIQDLEDDTGWICTDKMNKISMLWQDKDFNETQKVVPLEDFDAAKFMDIAKILREMTDWIAINHRDKV